MTDKEQALIRVFINDREMHSVVKALLLRHFLGKKDGDVYVLAAQTLAVQFLEDAFQEMERYKRDDRKERSNGNPAV